MLVRVLQDSVISEFLAANILGLDTDDWGEGVRNLVCLTYVAD